MAWTDSVDIYDLPVSRDAEALRSGARPPFTFRVTRAPLRRLRVAANRFGRCRISGQQDPDQQQREDEQPGRDIETGNPAILVGDRAERKRREADHRAEDAQVSHVDSDILLLRGSGDIVREVRAEQLPGAEQSERGHEPPAGAV